MALSEHSETVALSVLALLALSGAAFAQDPTYQGIILDKGGAVYNVKAYGAVGMGRRTIQPQ